MTGKSSKWWPWVFVVLCIVETVWLVSPSIRAVVLRLEESDVASGRRLAGELGCFSCHGPGGRGGVANPGSEDETVPAFNEGTPMMYVHNDEEIRAYILDGAPPARRRRASYRRRVAAAAVHMPAYGGRVSKADVDALVAYVRAASELLQPADARIKKGAVLARASGCFACHGEMGSGGRSNPGSLKGYIPGFLGKDYRELVGGREELTAWIRDGKLARVSEDPIGSFFFRRQVIRMPAYRRFLAETEIDSLVAYVEWLARGDWRRQPLLRKSRARQR